MRKALFRLQKPYLLALSAAPLSVLMGLSWLADRPALWFLDPLLYFVTASALLPVHGKRRPLFGALGCAVILGLSLALLPWMEMPGLLLMPVLYCALLFGFLRDCSLPVEVQLPPQVPIFGLVAYIVLQFWISLTKMPATQLQVCFLLWLPAALFYMNRSSLSQASMDGRSALPPSIRRRNSIMISALSVGAVLVSLLPAIASVLGAVWSGILWCLRWIIRLFGLLQSNSTVSDTAAESGGAMESLPAGEASPFWKFMEKVFYVVAALLVAFLVFLLLRAAWKGLRRLAHRLADRFRHYVDSASLDYEDEASDTRESDDTASRARRRSRRSDAPRGPMAPRERVRFSFRKLRSRDRHWNDTRTARDVLAPEAASTYEEARYSTHEIGSAQAEAFDAACRAVKVPRDRGK